MEYKYTLFNSKMYFDEIATVFTSRYSQQEKVNFKDMMKVTGYNRVKYRFHFNFLSDIGFADKSNLNKTMLGELVYKYDPYFDKEGTLWLMHYLAASSEYLLIWNMFFKEIYNSEAINLEEFGEKVIKYVGNNDKSFVTNIKKQIRTLLDTYLNQKFSNIGLISMDGKKCFSYRNQNIDELILLAILINFRDVNFKGATSISFKDICFGENSPAQILLLDEKEIRKKLESLKQKNIISIESRADLDQIRISGELNFLETLKMYFEGLD